MCRFQSCTRRGYFVFSWESLLLSSYFFRERKPSGQTEAQDVSTDYRNALYNLSEQFLIESASWGVIGNGIVYGNYNPAGAIYLDADCEELGLSSRNAVILGHHFWNDKKVAPMGTVADYKDVDFAREHARVLIQTPTAKMTYEARFAQIVNGRERNKRIDFEGESDFRAWYGESRENAAMVLDAETEPEQVISLVTCSYNIWVDNERTVLVTSMQETAKNQAENTQIAPDAS